MSIFRVALLHKQRKSKYKYHHEKKKREREREKKIIAKHAQMIPPSHYPPSSTYAHSS